MAFMSGESSMTLLLLFLNYAIYIAIWVVLTLLVSIAFTKRSTVLAAMTGLWFSFSLVLPSIAVSITADTVPVAGKIETDLAMLSSLRKLGDGHNANDPAFQQLRADVLKKYNVERIEDLPVNFRGIVAMEGEQKLTKVLNEFANLRMAAELSQTEHLADYGWLTPMLAITVISRTLAGTDLAHYHRFQREAEAVRLAFVQGLNRAHIETLSYEDDINRNKNEDAWQRARVDAANWQVLDAFQFNTASLTERINSASPSIRILLAWLIALLGLLLWSCKRVMP
jgi:ABC-2 type transport system permease protein